MSTPSVAHRDPAISAVVLARTPRHYHEGADPGLDRPAHVRAGSSLAWVPGGIAVVQDDANFLAVHDLMDRMPGPDVVDPIRRAATSVAGVRAIERLAVRKSGMAYRVTIHVQADPMMPLHEAHVLGGKVKGAIRAAVPQVASVLVHMEPIVDTPSRASVVTSGTE